MRAPQGCILLVLELELDSVHVEWWEYYCQGGRRKGKLRLKDVSIFIDHQSGDFLNQRYFKIWMDIGYQIL